MANYLSQIALPNNTVYTIKDRTINIYSAICTTAAAEAIKDITCPELTTIVRGTIIFITFTATNSAAVGDLRLRINSNDEEDAKIIKHQYNISNQSISNADYISANQTYRFYFDGTDWVISDTTALLTERANKLTDITSSDAATSTDTWRNIWFNYDDNTTGRPAYSNDFVYQTSTSTLKMPHILIEHVENGSNEVRIQYSTTIDMAFTVGSDNVNHGIYDSKASAWILYAGSTNIWTLHGNAETATEFSSDATVTLTGDTTGVSGGSTKNWSIATTTKYLSGTSETDAALTTSPGTGKIRYSYNVSNPTGIFNRTDNSNAILTFNRHSGNYHSQLGFSSDGRLYYRSLTGAALNNTTTWNKIAWMSDIEALDGVITGSAGAGKTLTSFSQTDGKVTATFADISITKSQISDFAHTHAYLANTNTGAADRPIYIKDNAPTQTTYRMAGTNATATTALAITTNLPTGIWYVNGTNSTDLYSQSDGVAYVEQYSTSWIHEIYGDYRTGQIAVRGKNNGTWTDWRKILDSSNFTSYVTVVNNNVNLSRDTETTIATIAGTAIKIKLPASDNTWRPIGTGATDAMAGNTVVTNVKQQTTTSSKWRKVLLSGGDDYAAFNTAVGNDIDSVVYRAVGISAQPSTGTLHATTFDGSVITLDQGSTANPSTTSGARIRFTYSNGKQAVHIAYTPNDPYRAPAGLKIMGNGSTTGSDISSPAWLEIEGQLLSKDYTHFNSNGIADATIIMGARGLAPTATTTNNTTTYSGAVIGTAIFTLGNNKIGEDSASGVNDNARGFLRIYSDGSSYGEITAYKYTLNAIQYSWILPTSGIAFPSDKAGIVFRPENSSQYVHISYQSNGDGALVYSTTTSTSSFIFINNESLSSISSNRWQNLDGSGNEGKGNAPGLQIKNNCVSIGELIPNNTTPSTYKLTVNGNTLVKGQLYIGTQATTYAMPITGINIWDTRGADFSPSAISKGVNYFFTNTPTPTSTWCAGIYVRGWTGNNYAAWCIVGPANNGDYSTTPLYIRTSKNSTTWGSYRKIYDTSNKPTPSDIGAPKTDGTGASGTWGISISGNADNATNDGSGNNIVNTYATKDQVNGLLAAADAMIFKGTLGTGGTITAVPNGTSSQTYQAGYTYRVITAGKYANIQCEVGDLLIAISDSTANQTAINNAHWTVAQTNIDGAVTGPSSATSNAIARFNGTGGKVIKNSVLTIDDNGSIIRKPTDSNKTHPVIWLNADSKDSWLWQVSTDNTNKMYYGYGLKYVGSGATAAAKYLELMADNENGTETIALSVDQYGHIGIGGLPSNNHSLNITGGTNFNGIFKANGLGIGVDAEDPETSTSDYHIAKINGSILITTGSETISNVAHLDVKQNSSNVYYLDFIPAVNGVGNIGTSSARWADGHFANTITLKKTVSNKVVGVTLDAAGTIALVQATPSITLTPNSGNAWIIKNASGELQVSNNSAALKGKSDSISISSRLYVNEAIPDTKTTNLYVNGTTQLAGSVGINTTADTAGTGDVHKLKLNGSALIVNGDNSIAHFDVITESNVTSLHFKPAVDGTGNIGTDSYHWANLNLSTKASVKTGDNETSITPGVITITNTAPSITLDTTSTGAASWTMTNTSGAFTLNNGSTIELKGNAYGFKMNNLYLNADVPNSNAQTLYVNGTTHLVNKTGIGVAPDSTHDLYVNGKTKLNGNVGIGANADSTHKLYVNGTSKFANTVNFVKQVNFANGTTYYVDASGNAKFNSLTLDTASFGNNSTVGSDVKPIYWNAGVPSTLGTKGNEYLPVYFNAGEIKTVTLVQKIEWTMTQNKKSVKIAHTSDTNAFTADSIVIQIVVHTGQQYVQAPLKWVSAAGYIAINTSTAVTGEVKGYILVIQGKEVESSKISLTQGAAEVE